MKLRRKIFTVISLSITLVVSAQYIEKNTITAIYQNALTSYDAYNNLNELCTKASGRLVGSKESEKAIQILKTQIRRLTPDTCFLQNYVTASWRCKSPCEAILYNGSKKESLQVVNLGLSGSTPSSPVQTS